MTAVPHPARTLPLRISRAPGEVANRAIADRATRRRRRLRLARTLVGVSVRTRLLPAGDSRRQRRRVCGAADTLTALGVRVRVLPPVTPWPRTGRLVVSDHVGRLGDLALSTALRGAPMAGSGVRAVAPGSVVCPVAVRYRLEGGREYLRADQVPQTTAGIVAMRGLVVEVHCLPAIDAVPAGAR
jgi:hypothetical protein